MQIRVYSLDKGGFSSACHSYRYNCHWLFVLFHRGTRGSSDIHGRQKKKDICLAVWEYSRHCSLPPRAESSCHVYHPTLQKINAVFFLSFLPPWALKKCEWLEINGLRPHLALCTRRRRLMTNSQLYNLNEGDPKFGPVPGHPVGSTFKTR
jgi:hypothetical protein